MIQKWIGAACVMSACWGCGFGFAAAHRREENALGQLEQILTAMENELTCRETPLPQLLRRTTTGEVGNVLTTLADELEKQVFSDVRDCMDLALIEHPRLPPKTAALLGMLGASLGKFDLDGQLRELASVRAECSRVLSAHRENQADRLRNYHTLGICAGLVLAILLL